MVEKNGLMGLFLKEVFYRVRKVGKGPSNGLMAVVTSVTLLRITSMEMVCTFGATNAGSKDSGQTTKWKVTEYSLGQTIASTKVNTSTI